MEVSLTNYCPLTADFIVSSQPLFLQLIHLEHEELNINLLDMKLTNLDLTGTITEHVDTCDESTTLQVRGITNQEV